MFQPADTALALCDDTAARINGHGAIDAETCGGVMFLRQFIAESGEQATIDDALTAFEQLPGSNRVAWAVSMLGVQDGNLYEDMVIRLVRIVARNPITAYAATGMVEKMIPGDPMQVIRGELTLPDEARAILRNAFISSGMAFPGIRVIRAV